MKKIMDIPESNPKRFSKKDNKDKVRLSRRLTDMVDNHYKRKLPEKGYIFSKEEIAETTNEERFAILYEMIHEEKKEK